MCHDKPGVPRIKASELFGLARELFRTGKSIKIVVSGNSMYPFIRTDRDMVTIKGATLDEVKVSDIVLAFRESDHSYVLHRLFKKTDREFYMVGDRQDWLDGPYPASSLIGVVTEVFRVRRDGTEKMMDGLWYRFIVRLWMLLRPVRMPIIKVYFRLRGVKIHG